MLYAPEGKVYVFAKIFFASDTIVVEYGVTEGRYRWVLERWLLCLLCRRPHRVYFSMTVLAILLEYSRE